MCDLCGQVHADMVSVRGLTVCASRRHCLLYTLRNADEVSIARMWASALDSTLRATEGIHTRTLELAAS
jgi:hypothetical protein